MYLVTRNERSNNDGPVFTERRKYKRIPANIYARFFYGSMFYSGKVKDLSERGMFIITKRCLPFGSTFLVIIRGEKNLIRCIVRVKRLIRSNGDCDGIGVELLRPDDAYLKIVRKLKKTA